MRMALIVLWLGLGLSGLIFHLGPGVEWRAVDQAGHLLRQARQDVERGDYRLAVENFDRALEVLPEAQPQRSWTIRLEKAKAQMLATELPEAREALEGLLAELMTESPGDTNLVDDTRSALASSQYYVTWLMRLEGLPKDIWEPEIEAARQNYRVLAEHAQADGDDETVRHRREDLEAAIRLARMDLSELQALPLPCQCSGCCSNTQRGRERRKPSEKTAEGASFNVPPHEGS